LEFLGIPIWKSSNKNKNREMMELDHGDGAVYPTAPKNDILTDNILAKTGIL
jgi:hypothetical protein